MAKIHINITEELRERLQLRARQEGRSMTEQVNFLIRQDVELARIPIVGTIDDDGKVSFTARLRKWKGYTEYLADPLDPRD